MERLRKILLKRVRPKGNGPFLHSLLTLFTGTSLAQVIPIAISPLLTRLYAPEEFGLFALYSALISTFSGILSLRYEIAILQPKEEKKARVLIFLSLIIVGMISFLIFLLAIFYNQFQVSFLGNEQIRPYLYLLPLSLCIVGGQQVVNRWLLREGRFRTLASCGVVKGLGSGGCQLGLSFGGGAAGLIIGQIVGQFGSLFYSVRGLDFKRMIWQKKEALIRDIRPTAHEYKNMPIFSAPGALADNFSLQAPIFFITHSFTEAVTGAFSFTFKILNLPMGVLTRAVSQVFYQRLAERYKMGGGGYKKDIYQIVFTSSVLMTFFVLAANYWGEPTFVFVFGDEWEMAGKISKQIAVAIAIRFIVSPLSSMLSFKENVKLGLAWQIIYFLTISTTLFVFRDIEIYNFIRVFVIHEVVLYLVYLAFIYKGALNLERRALCVE